MQPHSAKTEPDDGYLLHTPVLDAPAIGSFNGLFARRHNRDHQVLPRSSTLSNHLDRWSNNQFGGLSAAATEAQRALPQMLPINDETTQYYHHPSHEFQSSHLPSYLAAQYQQAGPPPDHLPQQQDSVRVPHAQQLAHPPITRTTSESALAGWDGRSNTGDYAYHQQDWNQESVMENQPLSLVDTHGDDYTSGNDRYIAQHDAHTIPSDEPFLDSPTDSATRGYGYGMEPVTPLDSFESIPAEFSAKMKYEQSGEPNFGSYVTQGQLASFGSSAFEEHQYVVPDLQYPSSDTSISPPASTAIPVGTHIPFPIPFQPQPSYTLAEAMLLPATLPPSPTSSVSTPSVIEKPPSPVMAFLQPPMASLQPPMASLPPSDTTVPTKRPRGRPRKHPLIKVAMPAIPPSTSSTAPAPLSPLSPLTPQVDSKAGANYPFPVFPFPETVGRTTPGPSERPSTPRTIPLPDSAAKPGQSLFRLSDADAARQPKKAKSKARDAGEGEKKQPVMACLFCRERKIACGQPEVGGRKCNQCARRNLVCEFPKESRRGMHKRGPRAPRTAALAHIPASPSVPSVPDTLLSAFPSSSSISTSASSSFGGAKLGSPSRGESDREGKGEGKRERKSGIWDRVASAKRRAVLREEQRERVNANRERRAGKEGGEDGEGAVGVRMEMEVGEGAGA